MDAVVSEMPAYNYAVLRAFFCGVWWAASRGDGINLSESALLRVRMCDMVVRK